MSLQTDKDTICYKVDVCIDLSKQSMETQTLDIYSLITNLGLIKKDAQRMENALKLRKQLMEKHGIEEEYKQLKGEKNKTVGINKMPDHLEVTEKTVNYHVTVKDTDGNVIYDRGSFAGVFSVVENIEDIDELGMINGVTQQFAFGHDIAIWYAFDQLKQGIETQLIRIALGLKNAIENKMFSDPEKKKAMLDRMNGRK